MGAVELKGTEFIVQTLFDYLKGTELADMLSGGLYKYKRPIFAKDEDSRKIVGVIACVAGTVSSVQTYRCNVNVYVPSLLVGETYYPDNTSLAAIEKKSVELLRDKVVGDCLIRYADTPTYFECTETYEWLVNNSLDVLFL